MPDPTTLNALAAVLAATEKVIAALGTAAVAIAGLVVVLRRGQRAKDDSDHPAP